MFSRVISACLVQIAIGMVGSLRLVGWLVGWLAQWLRRLRRVRRQHRPPRPSHSGAQIPRSHTVFRPSGRDRSEIVPCAEHRSQRRTPMVGAGTCRFSRNMGGLDACGKLLCHFFVLTDVVSVWWSWFVPLGLVGCLVEKKNARFPGRPPLLMLLMPVRCPDRADGFATPGGHDSGSVGDCSPLVAGCCVQPRDSLGSVLRVHTLGLASLMGLPGGSGWGRVTGSQTWLSLTIR